MNQEKTPKTIESIIENELIKQLTTKQGYILREDIKDNKALEHNFKQKFEELNQVKLSDKEFKRLYEEIITADVFLASKRLREKNTFIREDGSILYYNLVNTKEWCKNDFEVCQQPRFTTRNSIHRYDVILLINGLPLVQIELKNYSVQTNKALEQIIKYKNDEESSYSKTLMCFVQIFIISNKNTTRYFANNNTNILNQYMKGGSLPIYQYSDKNNMKIDGLYDFTEKVLAKCEIAKLISRYMVLLAKEEKLLIMRPYQIYAVEAIVSSIKENRGNGYIWHTTGSGKTLTSFKAATLLKEDPNIDKCLFVVDRKDLDRQTRDEFNKFQEGCVEENASTQELITKMTSTDYADKVIVTTIQKLGIALAEAKEDNKSSKRKNYRKELQGLEEKRIIFIFDECHRSQFGENHEAIKNFFKKAQLFGFTGTPIFRENASQYFIKEEKKHAYTTEELFKNLLHSYTITNAIEDKNVLQFHIDYFKPEVKRETKMYCGLPSETIETPDYVPAGTTSPMVSKEMIVETILKKHNNVTKQRMFNALFATSSINDAIKYYNLFKEKQEDRIKENPDYVPLNIACVFSPPAKGNNTSIQNQDDTPQEIYDNKTNPSEKEEALKNIIKEYNQKYGTNHNINEFDNYYRDIQLRIKQQQYSNKDYPHHNKIDITIVVDMLLTGYDSKYLNTLYIDKNVYYHSLIQAFSRTNRTLNANKPYGSILDFRAQKKQVEDAITLYSGIEKPKAAREIWCVEKPKKVIEKYQTAVDKLHDFMQKQNLQCTPEQVSNIKGEQARAEFVEIIKEIQSIKTRLDQYTDLTEEQTTEIEQILSPETLTGFKVAYIDMIKPYPKPIMYPEPDEPMDEIDFELVLFASCLVDYDYIVKLVAKYIAKPEKEKHTEEQIIDLLRSTSDMIDEREELTQYVRSIFEDGKILNEDEIKQGFIQFKKEKEYNEVLTIANQYGLEYNTLNTFLEETIQRCILDAKELVKLFDDQNLDWEEQADKEKQFVIEIYPFLAKRTNNKEISGMAIYIK
ncbi:MAG: HsdR family type I site-specific deoxyribonuclease [Capnocytophaga sp.]|nr:HsdR family type I site-specific deoxyribonuclease [Capnocytophaga sp.]